MKKLLAVCLAILMAFGIPMGGIAMENGNGCDPVQTGEELPPGSVPHYAWYLSEQGSWVGMNPKDRTVLARAFSSYPMQGACNKFVWEVPITVHASVAQWVEFSHSGTRYDWRVRKPGTYAANSLTFTLKSNSDVCIRFDGFENLRYVGSARFPGVKQDIETWYAFGEGEHPGDFEWISPSKLNKRSYIKDSANLHEGISWKLWNKIKVENCNSACEYQDDAMLTVVLLNQKVWIDGRDGYFQGSIQ